MTVLIILSCFIFKCLILDLQILHIFNAKMAASVLHTAIKQVVICISSSNESLGTFIIKMQTAFLLNQLNGKCNYRFSQVNRIYTSSGLTRGPSFPYYFFAVNFLHAQRIIFVQRPTYLQINTYL